MWPCLDQKILHAFVHVSTHRFKLVYFKCNKFVQKYQNKNKGYKIELNMSVFSPPTLFFFFKVLYFSVNKNLLLIFLKKHDSIFEFDKSKYLVWELILSLDYMVVYIFVKEEIKKEVNKQYYSSIITVLFSLW